MVGFARHNIHNLEVREITLPEAAALIEEFKPRRNLGGHHSDRAFHLESFAQTLESGKTYVEGTRVFDVTWQGNNVLKDVPLADKTVTYTQGGIVCGGNDYEHIGSYQRLVESGNNNRMLIFLAPDGTNPLLM